jgi:hypothetical protein
MTLRIERSARQGLTVLTLIGCMEAAQIPEPKEFFDRDGAHGSHPDSRVVRAMCPDHPQRPPEKLEAVAASYGCYIVGLPVSPAKDNIDQGHMHLTFFERAAA